MTQSIKKVIIKHIKPIISTKKGSTYSDDQKSQDKIYETKEKTNKKPLKSKNVKKATEYKEESNVTKTVLDLYKYINKNRSKVIDWIGNKVYVENIKNKKKSSKCKKGILVDKNAK